MIKNILVTQDGSAYGSSALEYSIWLARKFEASLIGHYVVDVVSLEGPFLHDLSASIGFEPFLNFSAKMREIMEAKGKEILTSFDEACSSAEVSAETVVSFGIVSNEICTQAKLADLVVVGRRGLNEKFEHGMLGSVTEGVIRKSSKPVLITPKVFKAPEKLILAYDGGPSASKAMHSAAEWAKALGLPLTVVTASLDESGDTMLKDAEDYLKPYGLETRFVKLPGEYPPDEIVKFYKDNNHDLLFMGATRHSRIMEMVLGSTTEHVMRSVEGPFFLER
jgi:nucleotide-binding universal stress UspA family protein